MNDLLKRLALFFVGIGMGSILVVTVRAGNSVAQAIAIDQDQKIVLAGRADNQSNRTTDFALARYNLDGTIDLSFNPQGVFGGLPGRVTLDVQGTNDLLNAVAIDKDNKIVIAGSTAGTLTAGLTSELTSFSVARFNTDGSLDTTFNALGQLPGGPGVALIDVSIFSDVANGLAIDSNDRIVIVGTTSDGISQNVAVVRLTSDGSLDTSFDSEAPTSFVTTIIPGIITVNVRGTEDTATAVAIDALNSIYIGGFSDSGLNTDFLVIKLNENGTLDTSFNQFSLIPGIIIEDIRETEDRAFALKLDAQNNIIVAGSSSNGFNLDFALMRFTPEGVLDETFDPPGSVTRPGIVVTDIAGDDDEIKGVACDAENRIVITGFSNIGFNRAFATARYTTDGSLDTTFNSTGVTPGVVITNIITLGNLQNNDNEANGIAIVNQNDIIATGFSHDGVQTNFTTANYLEDGQLNPAFNAGGLEPPGDRLGIVFTLFGEQQVLQGNGVPLLIGGDISQVSPEIRKDLQYPLEPRQPAIIQEGLRITSDYQPTLQGVSSPNAIIRLYVENTPLTGVMADAEGNWSATLPPLVDGTYTVTAQSIDPLSGLSLASVPVTVTITTEIPPAPLIEVPGRDARVVRKNVHIRGRALPDALVTIFIDAKPVGTTLVGKTGLWEFRSEPLSDGSHTLFATVTDQAGNISDRSDSTPFILDTGVEQAPRIISPRTGATFTKSAVTIQGEGKSNSFIHLYLNDTRVARVKTDKKGTWSYTLRNLKDGEYNIHVTTRDNRLSSDTRKFSVKTVTPQPAKIASAPPTKGLINGSGEPQGIVNLYLDGGSLGTTRADQQGRWSFTPVDDKKIPRGAHHIKVSVADQAGNISRFLEKDMEV